MPIIAANPLSATWYEPEEGGPRFHLRGLNPIDVFDVQAGCEIDTIHMQVKYTARAVRVAMLKGLIGWENFKDENGQDVKFGPDMLENVERLGYGLTNDLFIQIMAASKIDDAKRKN